MCCIYGNGFSYRCICAQLGCGSRKCSDQASSRHGLPHPVGRGSLIARTDSAKIDVSWMTTDAGGKKNHSLHSCRSSHGLSLQYATSGCSTDNQYATSSTNLNKHESEGDEHELTHGLDAIDSGAPAASQTAITLRNWLRFTPFHAVRACRRAAILLLRLSILFSFSHINFT
jgi:hypothetical protein